MSTLTRAAWSLLGLLALAAAGCAGPMSAAGAIAAPRKVAILPIASVGLPAEEARRLRTTIRDELGRRIDAPMSSDREVDAEAAGQQLCQGGGTDPERQDQCGARVGARLGASHALVGAIGALGRTHLIQLRVIDVSQAASVRSLEETLFGDRGTLRDAARSMAGRLFELRESRRPWYTRWWLWTLVGTVVAAAVTVPVVVVTRRPGDDGYQTISLP